MTITKPEALRRVLSQLAEVRREIRTANPSFSAKSEEEVFELVEKSLTRANHLDLAYFATLMSYASENPLVEEAIGAMLDEIADEAKAEESRENKDPSQN